MMRLVLVALVGFAMVGCTSVRVKPLDPALGVKHICIEENPRVTVPGFLDIVRDGFKRHGITSEVVSGESASGCDYVLTYTALRSWDIVTYLSHAELHLMHNDRTVAQAEYHLRGKGGLSLVKWRGVRTKMDPVLDQLLDGYD